MRRLVDVSRYQVERNDPLDLARAKAAGYSIANVALTGGRGYVSGPWAKTYVDRARALGMGAACYHWLDGRSSGLVQAGQQLTRMRQVFGSLDGFAHFVDIEESGANGIAPPTWTHVRDYVAMMQDALRRPIGIYSADYYWPKSWPGSTLTPYLMGPPNDPTGGDPGEDGPAWYAGWGGWGPFAVLQWGVKPLPGTGACSLSIVRDDTVWSALTGGADMASWILVPSLVSLRAEFNRLGPNRDKASDGSIGDTAHSQSSSDHNPDETGATPFEDADNVNEVHAIDVDKDGPWAPGWSMARAVTTIVERHRTGKDDRLQNVIFKLPGEPSQIWSRNWGWTARIYTGSNPHDHHAHFSARYTTAQENDTGPWGLIEEDDGMAGITQDEFNTRMDAWWNDRMKPPAEGASPNPALSKLMVAPWNVGFGREPNRRTAGELLAGGFNNSLAASEAIGQYAREDSARDQAIRTILESLPAAVTQAVLAVLPAGADPVTVDELRSAISGVFRVAFGDVGVTPEAQSLPQRVTGTASVQGNVRPGS